ncbi:hypothetical protein Tco_1278734, partial [Tanacetum coccineum]
YLDEARKKTQERDKNSKTSVMPSARFQRTADGSKPKNRSTNHSTRSFPCVFNANHDACIAKLLKEVISHAKIQSHKTRNSNKPVDQKSHTHKPDRQIFTGHMFSPNKTSAVYEKTSPRSDLRWKPTSIIFKFVGLRWIPTGKLFDSCTSKVDSEPPHGSNVDIPKIHKCKQTLDVSVGTPINVQKEQSLDLSACTLCNINKENLRPRSTTSTEAPTTNIIELESLFSPLFDEYFNGENQVVSKSFAVTTADASDKRQQQPDSAYLAKTSLLRNFGLVYILSYALSWKPCQGDSLNLPNHRIRHVLQPHSSEVGFINHMLILKLSKAQVDQGSQIKMIQVKEMMQDNDLKNSKSKDKGSRSRSQSMNEQSHYKQDKTKTRQSINVKSHIFNVIGGKPAIFSDSLAKKDFSKSKTVTKQNVSNDFSKPVTAQILPQNRLPIVKNTNVIAPGMYKVHTKTNQTRTPQLHQDIRKPNKRVSFSTGVIPNTSVSRPQLKSNHLEDSVMSIHNLSISQR